MKKLWIDKKRRMSKPALQRLYLSLLPRCRRIARRLGYALAVHGSCTRDFDLIAVPWTLEAVEPMDLAIALSKATAKYWKGRDAFEAEGFGGKPHGRKCFTLYLGAHGTGKPGGSKAIFIDLSVMPLV